MNRIRSAVLALLASVLAPLAIAQAVTFSALPVSGVGSVTPVLTWATAPVAKGCVASGDWSGPKGASGTATLAAITASKTYTLTCFWGDDRATVSWSVPTTNSDGAPITGLAGFRIYYGTTPNNLIETFAVSSPLATSQVIQPLAPATWYFAMSAVNTSGAESSQTTTVSKTTTAAVTVPSTAAITVVPVPSPPTNVVVAQVQSATVHPNVAVAYKYNNLTKAKGSAVVGLVPLGKPCPGSSVFTYRGQDYFQVAKADVLWWGIVPSAFVAAPCAAAG